jgi:hypothetical protein
MACVDKSDYMTNTYSFSRETLKWTKKLFTQILDLILWTNLPNSPPVLQYYPTNISDLYWSGTWHKKGNDCLTLTCLHTDTANWPDFMNIANICHWKEKQWNMDKFKKSRTQWEVVCQSMCQAIICQTHILNCLIWHWEKHNSNIINITIAIPELTYFRQQYLKMWNVAFTKQSTRYKEAFLECP